MTDALDIQELESRHADAIAEATDGLRVDHWIGGFKASGFGRECAAEALDDYSLSKAVGMRLEEP